MTILHQKWFQLIVLGGEYSFYVKSIATYAPQFFWYNNSVLAVVHYKNLQKGKYKNGLSQNIWTLVRLVTS